MHVGDGLLKQNRMASSESYVCCSLNACCRAISRAACLSDEKPWELVELYLIWRRGCSRNRVQLNELTILTPKDDGKRHLEHLLPLSTFLLLFDGVWMEKMMSRQLKNSEMEPCVTPTLKWVASGKRGWNRGLILHFWGI